MLPDAFLLRPDMVYLNHGAFGATPRVVFEEYQRWQLELERQPLEFLDRELEGRLLQARRPLADFLGTQVDRLAFVENATTGVNLVAWSLNLGPGDEVLLNNHEYGAVMRCWQTLSARFGFSLRVVELPWPVESPQQVEAALVGAFTDRTRCLCLSHITSPTAMVMPVRALCQAARERGIVSLVDGAHGPGLVDFSLEELGADFYAGNLHKWVCGPKGTGFLYCRAGQEQRLQPLVVSWGVNPPAPLAEPDWINAIQLQGTRDPAGFLSIPKALEFLASQHTAEVRQRCRDLAAEFPARSGLKSPIFEGGVQMKAVELPPGVDAKALQKTLWQEEGIEVPCFWLGQRGLLRVAVQSYNESSDLDALVAALGRRLR